MTQYHFVQTLLQVINPNVKFNIEYVEISKKKRYLCKHFRAISTDETPFFDKGCFISKEKKQLILTDLSETKYMSLTAIE